MRTDFTKIKCIGNISDERVAFIRSLSKRKNSGESDCFFLEGERAVSEVPAKAGTVRTVVLSKSYLDGIDAAQDRFSLVSSFEKAGAEIICVTDRIFGALSETVTPQGIGAVVNKPRIPVLDELLTGSRRILILENIQDPGNLGTCIRTADAFSFDAVICVDNCADVYNQKVLRSTVGSLFHLPVFRYRQDVYKLSVGIKAHGIRLFGADPRGGTDCTSELFGREKIAVIIGNEANGLSDRAKAVSDALVTIPMPGNAESLNAAIAAAVLMYEISRKNTMKEHK